MKKPEVYIKIIRIYSLLLLVFLTSLANHMGYRIGYRIEFIPIIFS